MKPAFIKKAIATAVGSLAISGLASAAGVAIEEVVVTAQKRAESLQDIPLAVTAFSGEQLREDSISTLEDIGSRTPGLVFAAFSVGQPEIAIRGVGTKEDGASASDSTVVSVDDIYIAARTAQVFDIFDLERVEVLRGPQGTLYGKNSIGGSINFVTSKPSEELTGRAQVTVGNYGRRDFGGMVSGPLTDGLLGKVSFSKRDYDGHIKNLLDGKRKGDQDTLAWRAQLLWNPSDNVSVLFGADGADDDMGDTNREPVGGTGLSANGDSFDPMAVNAAFGDNGDPWKALNDEEGFTDREVLGFNVKVDWDMGDVTFTSITSWRESDFDWAEDSEGLPGLASTSVRPADQGFRFDVTDSAIEETEQLTQEFRLTSNGEGNFNWVLGGFYSLEDVERVETFCIPNCGGTVIPVNYARLPNRLIVNASLQENESTSWAVYGQGTYSFTDTLSLTAGLRYSYEEKEMDAGAIVNLGIVPAGVFLQNNFSVSAEDDWSNVSGKLALDWKVTDEALLYASVSTGFKSGGFTGSASTSNRADASFDEETATSYEIGLKSQWFDNTLRLNIAAFFTDYEDLQVTRFFRPADNPANAFGEFITNNAGEAEISGFEVEFTWLATENLEFGGNWAYLDSEFTDFTPDVPDLAPGNGTLPCDAGSTAVSTNPADGCIPNYAGNDLRQAPKVTASLYGKYAFDLGDLGVVTTKLNYRYQDHSFYDPDNNAITAIPQYRIWDARVAWNSADGKWEVAGWVKNIGDEEYRTHVYSQRAGTIAFATFGAPRTSGVTVTFNY